MKKRTTCLLGITVLVILAILISCNPNIETTYPPWFDEYSGDHLANLKAVQDAYQCFGDTIGPNVISNGSYYDETVAGKEFMTTFEHREGEPLVDSTDIQPFRDAVLASGFILDDDPGSDTYNLYTKDTIVIGIYVISFDGELDHFEFMIDQVY